jgi:cardiolipin synthase
LSCSTTSAFSTRGETSWTNARVTCCHRRHYFATETSGRQESRQDTRSSPAKSKTRVAPPSTSTTPTTTSSTSSLDTKKQQEQEQQPQASTTNATTTDDYTIKTREELLQQWWHQLQSPPNLVTLCRIASTPLISFWIVTGQAEYAFAGGIIAAMSDALDGYLAKRYHMTTVVGTFLDPLADKLLINVVSVSLYSIAMLPGPLVLLWLTRDIVLVYYAHYYVMKNSSNNVRIMLDLTRTPLQIQPTLISKLNTGLQFLTLGTALAHPMILPWIPTFVLPGLWCVQCVLCV